MSPHNSIFYSPFQEVMPISAMPIPKRNFVPSKWELMRVTKIVKAMKEGRYKTREELKALREDEKAKSSIYMMWDDKEDDVLAESRYAHACTMRIILFMVYHRRFKFHLPAPKIPLPGHAVILLLPYSNLKE
jgi:hypothetical protein